LASFHADLMKGMGASERVFDLLERPAVTAGGIIIPEGEFKGKVEFDNVTFQFPTRDVYGACFFFEERRLCFEGLCKQTDVRGQLYRAFNRRLSSIGLSYHFAPFDAVVFPPLSTPGRCSKTCRW
jgi:ABC-type multidrug transport system fused ATPase/permease subunit